MLTYPKQTNGGVTLKFRFITVITAGKTVILHKKWDFDWNELRVSTFTSLIFNLVESRFD